MEQKTHIERNTVQETLVIPLYGRKLCTEQFPRLFRDEKAVELIDRIDYDFSALAARLPPAVLSAYPSRKSPIPVRIEANSPIVSSFLIRGRSRL